jgi:putative phage-type endonuclease
MSLTIEQRRARLEGLGGSDVAVALGLSPWRTQLQLWAEKTGNSPPPTETPAMEWGSRLESVIADKFRDENPQWTLETGNPEDLPLKHPDVPFLQALPDGIIMKDGKPVGIWEGKTSSVDWADDVPPIYYVLQVQHYMYVTGLKMAVISCLFRGREYVEYTVKLEHKDYTNHVLPELINFWKTVENNLPIHEPADLNELTWVQGAPPEEEEPLTASKEMLDLVMRVQTSDSVAKEAAAEAKKYKLELAKAMGDRKYLVTSSGDKLVTQYVTKDSVILDTKLIQKERPDLLEKYSKVKKGYRAMRVL